METVAVARSPLRRIDHLRSVRSPIKGGYVSISRGDALGRSSICGHPIETCVSVALVRHDRIIPLFSPFPFLRGERIDGQIAHLTVVRQPLEVHDARG